MPVIWLVDAYRAGEQSQVRALVDELGWPCETRRLVYRKHVVLPHVLGLASVRGITAESAATLKAPWPDLVISSGVRNEPVCRWIREQSGGHTRYVHVGKPWGPLSGFDLVVTTPQYRVPRRGNVVNNTLTLHSVSAQRLAAAREQWQDSFADLPRPRIGLVVGGNSGPFTFGPRSAARLARQVSTLARQSGGSLLVSTSARTGKEAIETLQAGISGVPHYFYRWQPDDPANPYFGILATADRLIVTGDSIGMLSEACATGRPVQIYDVGGMRGETEMPGDFRLTGKLYALLLRWLWEPLSRDITLVHRQLRAAGRAFWLDEEIGAAVLPGQSDMQRAVAAVRGLLGEV